jgi:hypothetical protein
MLLHALTRQRLNKEAEKGLFTCCALYFYYVLRAWSIHNTIKIRDIQMCLVVIIMQLSAKQKWID